jgi:hypothetical protein
VARLFAVLLLAWTTADLCGGLCMHDHEPIAAAWAAGPSGARSIASARGEAAPLPSPPDDCFCCSRFVQPQSRCQFVPTYTFLASVGSPPESQPRFSATPFYHPPLA